MPIEMMITCFIFLRSDKISNMTKNCVHQINGPQIVSVGTGKRPAGFSIRKLIVLSTLLAQ